MTLGTGGAFVLAGIIARGLARDLDVDLAHDLARVHARACDLARDLGRDIDLEPDVAIARAGDIADDLSRPAPSFAIPPLIVPCSTPYTSPTARPGISAALAIPCVPATTRFVTSSAPRLLPTQWNELPERRGRLWCGDVVAARGQARAGGGHLAQVAPRAAACTAGTRSGWRSRYARAMRYVGC
jgi:hypothetical protein